MDERDMKIFNMRAQLEGQEKTIEEQAAEITRLRKRDVELTQRLEDAIQELEKTKAELEELHAVYNKTVTGIRQLMDKINK